MHAGGQATRRTGVDLRDQLDGTGLKKSRPESRYRPQREIYSHRAQAASLDLDGVVCAIVTSS